MTAALRRALVLGGSGHVGQAVVRALRAADVPTTFTWHRNAEVAQTLALETRATAVQVDLRAASAVALLATTMDSDAMPNVVVHCAAVAPVGSLATAGMAAFDDALAVNGRSAYAVGLVFGEAMAAAGGGDIVLVGALDRGQSLPLPVAFAASQGLLGALTTALAKELAPRGVRVNLVALGMLQGGLSQRLDAALRDQFLAFSALRRPGTAAEVARAIVWLALHNTYMAGKVLPINGGT